MIYKKIKKSRRGKCSICGVESELTWDHIPPKSCGNKEGVRIKNIFSINENDIGLASQNGTKYRTVCCKCNNELMGSGYDKVLTDFFNMMMNYLQNNLTNILGIRFITTDFPLLIKSVFCKFLGMDTSYIEDKPTQHMRRYIFEDKLEDDINLYFRFYPYDCSVNARGIVAKKMVGYGFPSTSGLVSFMYFFPMAFLLSTDKEENCGADLTKAVRNNFKELIIPKSTIFFNNSHDSIPPTWPAIVDDGTIVMTNHVYTNSLSTKISKR